MALPPQKFREIVFLILFSSEFQPDLDETSLMLMAELKVTKRAVLEAYDRASQILSNLAEIDEKIRLTSQEYQFDRISSSEKCALRPTPFAAASSSRRVRLPHDP